MFQAGIFSLGVLADDAKIDILMASLVTGDVLNKDDRGEDVEFLAKSNVERLVAGALHGSEKDSFEA